MVKYQDRIISAVWEQVDSIDTCEKLYEVATRVGGKPTARPGPARKIDGQEGTDTVTGESE